MIGSPKAAVLVVLLMLSGLLACAAAPPKASEPEAPEPIPSSPPAPAEPSEVQSDIPTEEPEAEPPEPEPEPEPEAPSKPSKAPSQVLTEPDTDFLLDYPASALKEAAQAKCRAEHGTSPELEAACMNKARDDFSGDVLSFRTTGGLVTWTIYRRMANRLDEVYTAKVKLKDASESTVVLTSAGPAKGQRPFLRGQRELTLAVPDDYTLVLTDPDLGKLVYRAKYGLVNR